MLKKKKKNLFGFCSCTTVFLH